MHRPQPPNKPRLLALAGETLGTAGLIMVMIYAVPLGFELLQR